MANVKTIDEVVAVIMDKYPDASEQEIRKSAETLAPLPEGYSRINPETFDFGKLPIRAYAYPPIMEDGKPAVGITVGKEYELYEPNPMLALIADAKVSLITDDGQEASSQYAAMFGWAVKDDEQ